MRAFIAIPIPPEIKAVLLELQRLLPIGHPVPDENLHLTLAFLGDQSEADLEDLHHRLTGLGNASFNLSLNGLGFFGNKSARILFSEVVKTPPLLALHGALKHEILAAGMQLDHSRFRPHVTLTRFAGRGIAVNNSQFQEFLTQYGGFQVPGFTASSFALYQSVLGRGPPVYEILAQYSLS